VGIHKKDGAIKNLQAINKDLSSYVNSLENLVYKGKEISEVAKKSRAQSALWFATSFVLWLKSLTVRKTKSGELHAFNVDTKTSEATSSHGEKQSGGLEALS